MDYKQYQHLLFERREDGVLLITINRPDKLNAANYRLHWELEHVWKDVEEDEETRVVVITGAGKAFSAGGENSEVEETVWQRRARHEHDARRQRYCLQRDQYLDKPIVLVMDVCVSAEAGAVALLADISIAAENARIIDGHVRFGVAAGDHAPIIWPLLCGMAKAKYYLLTCDTITGKEAERIGLVSMCVPADQLMTKALEVAHRLGRSPQQALKWTKRSLNNWLRMFGPTFDMSLALKMLGFMGPDVKEGIRAIMERREPNFHAKK